MTQKIRFIFLPFLIIAISFIAGYTLLNWLLFIRFQVFNIKEDVLSFWLPFVLPWIPVLIWLRPKIKLLNLKRKNGDLPSLFMFIAAIAIAAPTIMAQQYLLTATGELATLEGIAHFDKQEKSKYIILQKHYIDKQHIGVYNTVGVSGKHNEYYDMHIYIVLPIRESIADTVNTNCFNWIGCKYYKHISNRLSSNQKEARFKDFANEKQQEFDEKNFESFVYLDKMGNTDDRDNFNKAVNKSNTFEDENSKIFLPVNEPFTERNGNKLAWIFGSFAIGATVWLIMILIAKFDELALKNFINGTGNEKSINSNEETKDLYRFFIPREGFFATPIIMYINIAIFMLMVFTGLGFISFKSEDLLAWGANYGPYTEDGQWWRLSTNIFLHGGAMHLLGNMYGLLFVGINLEPVLGKKKYVLSYFVTGIIASLISLWWHTTATVSVGASGAIFGLFGIFLVLMLTKVFPKQVNKAFLLSTFIFIGYNLIAGLAGGIDNAAHIGGLISGFIIGFFLSPSLKKEGALDEMEIAQK